MNVITRMMLAAVACLGAGPVRAVDAESKKLKNMTFHDREWLRGLLVEMVCVMLSVAGAGAAAGSDGGGPGRILLPQKTAVDSYDYELWSCSDVLCDGVREPKRWRETWASWKGKVEPHWAELQFAAPVTAKAVAIHWNTGNGVAWSPRSYKIQSWDGKAYQDIIEVKDNPPAPFTLHVLDEIKTDRIRVWQPAGGGPAGNSNIMWIAEIEVYDYAKTAADFRTESDKAQQRQIQAESRARTIGVYKRSRHTGRTGAVEGALAKLGKRTLELDYLDERELKRCGMVVLADLRVIPNRDVLLDFIYNGGSVLFVHDACGRSGGAMLPNIWEYAGLGQSELVVKDKMHPVGKGLPEHFAHAYADHVRLKAGKAGKTVLVDTEGNAVVVAGQMGAGKVIAMGNLLGLASGPNWENAKNKMPEGGEWELFKNSINWLAEGMSLKEDWKESPAAAKWRKKEQARKPLFTDVTEACGMDCRWYSKGVAMVDAHESGRLDIFATLCGPTVEKRPNLFYRNEGNWKFTEVAEKAGIGTPPGIGCVFGDVNGDGHLDLFVCWMPEMGNQGRSTLYLGDGKGGFRDVTDAGGIGGVGNVAQCLMSDVDNDGDIDLYLIGFCQDNKLFRNRGDGTFEDATAIFGLAGVGNGGGQGYGAIGASMADLNGDGFQDLVCFSGGALRIFRNKGGKGFEEVPDYMGPEKPVIAGGSLGLALGDIDNDGDLDIYDCGTHKLLRNDGNMRFTDITVAAGLDKREQNIGSYCPIFADIDNDGHLDLFIGVGGLDCCVFHNDGDGTFTDVTGIIGLNAFAVHGCNFGDLDNDGDLDFYSTAWGKHDFKLLRNNQDDKNYLKVRVKGRKTNTSGIGVKVWVYEEREKKERLLKGYSEIRGGGGAMYTCPVLEQHFGLLGGGKYSVDALFPVSGQRVSVTNVNAAQTIVIEEP